MSPLFISSIIGIALAVMTLGQVVPSVSQAIYGKKVEISAGREDALAQQIVLYRNNEGAYPADVAALIAGGYWTAASNNNGFGGDYAFTVDGAKARIAIQTTIANAEQRAIYLNSYQHTYKPVDTGGGVVTTTFVMPSTGATAVPVLSGSSILASGTAPNPVTNTYWYDTSGSTAVLKVSTGSAWVAASGGSGGGSPAPSAANIVGDVTSLPVSASEGDIKYVYDASGLSMGTYVYYNGGWAVVAGGVALTAPVITVGLSAATLVDAEVGSPYSVDLKPRLSANTTSQIAPLTIDFNTVTWGIFSGALPAGLTLGVNGTIAGTPTTETPGATFQILATYLGVSGQQTYVIKVGPAILRVVSIAAGDSHTCAVLTTGGAKCWGWNGVGRLGDGTTTQRTAPVDVSGLTTGVASISAGDSHTCVVLSSGGAKCWGSNNDGQLGDGTTTQRWTPVNVSGLTTGVVSIAAGTSHTCALLTTGGVKCWGSNNGRLGDGTTTNRLTPVDVSGLTSGVASFAGGNAHTCALLTSGGAKCWGDNTNGQLGDGTTTQRTTPADVSGLTTGVASFAGGVNHTCALLTTGGAKCWGWNWAGQLGDGTTTQRTTPVDVVGLTSGVANIAGGSSYTCAVLTTGGAKCWGSNGNGRLGDGTTTSSSIPVAVSGLSSGVVSLEAGTSHTCAVLNTGGVKCWGNNGNGQLGDGTTTNRLTPVPVSGFPN